jgi:hypothetical protein
MTKKKLRERYSLNSNQTKKINFRLPSCPPLLAHPNPTKKNQHHNFKASPKSCIDSPASFAETHSNNHFGANGKN